jgi:hypothetical protein
MTLALHAQDEEDLEVISAYLQDAVGVMGGMAYQREKRRFAMVVNRFLWEKDAKAGLFQPAVPQRIQTGIHFEGVEKVRVHNLPYKEKDAAFDLLAIRFVASSDPDDPSGAIELDFAGTGTLRLEVECIDVFMADRGEPWPVARRPRHPGA